MSMTKAELKLKWKPIIDTVSKTNVPSNLIHRLVLKLDGESTPKQKTINIRKLRNKGVAWEDIDVIVDWQLHENAQQIKGVDMFVDVEAVAEIVQPMTDQYL